MLQLKIAPVQAFAFKERMYEPFKERRNGSSIIDISMYEKTEEKAKAVFRKKM